MRPLLFVISLLVLLSFPSNAAPVEWVQWLHFPQVALTFDDGPHPEPTERLCEVLSRFNVPATFFIVGRVAVQFPDVLRMLSSQGHEVANHTWNHSDIRFLTKTALRQELDQTRLLIHSATGQNTFLFRTPGGTEAYIRRHVRVPSGYELVLWDIHSLDQEGLAADIIARRVLSQVKNGDIILMHNGLSTTRNALEVIIPALQSRGYQFVTVSTLLKNHRSNSLYVRRPTAIPG